MPKTASAIIPLAASEVRTSASSHHSAMTNMVTAAARATLAAPSALRDPLQSVDTPVRAPRRSTTTGWFVGR